MLEITPPHVRPSARAFHFIVYLFSFANVVRGDGREQRRAGATYPARNMIMLQQISCDAGGNKGEARILSHFVIYEKQLFVHFSGRAENAIFKVHSVASDKRSLFLSLRRLAFFAAAASVFTFLSPRPKRFWSLGRTSPR